MNLLFFRLIAATAILIFFAMPSSAEPEDDSDFSMRITDVRMLTLDRNTVSFEPGITEILEGWSKHELVNTHVSANVPWVYTINGTKETWEGPWEKPVTDIYWKYGGMEYASLTISPAIVATGGPCNNQAYPIHFKIKLDIGQDIPGEYFYSYILFELTAP